MPCRIYLRHDQSVLQRQLFSTNLVTIFAPVWVKEGLKTLGQHLNGVKFDVYESHPDPDAEDTIVESFTITEDFNHQSLATLQKIARNEAHNISGVMNKTLYEDIKDPKLLYSIRDLVRQCIIVGVDTCSSCGGYKCAMESQNRSRVYLCDLAALQFQQPYNTGRLILVQKNEHHKGILDDFIYANVVGEQRQSFEKVLDKWANGDVATNQRYLRHGGFGPGNGPCFIDTKAYCSFVKMDVILSGTAIAKMVTTHHPEDKINFKFLKYGTGFFARKFANELDRLILSGVLDGLEQLFMKPDVLNAIKCVELPFYKSDPKSDDRIKALISKFGIHVVFGNNDALKESTIPNLIVATTNCGDNHTVCGE